ncbi:MAG: hypothetical protein Q4B70_05700 [Lachnospiraceae bacterium]|nr:hypothetical protein [Lachnospiraceae bacterium]
MRRIAIWSAVFLLLFLIIMTVFMYRTASASTDTDKEGKMISADEVRVLLIYSCGNDEDDNSRLETAAAMIYKKISCDVREIRADQRGGLFIINPIADHPVKKEHPVIKEEYQCSFSDYDLILIGTIADEFLSQKKCN